MKNSFEILGIPYDATEDVIKSAYRRLAMEHHPDLNPGDNSAEERFKEVNAAYEELKDPGRRAQAQARAQGRSGFNEAFDVFNGFRHHPGEGFSFDLNDLFANLARQHARPRNNDLTVAVTISLEDAFKGKELLLTIQAPDGPRQITTRIPPGIDNGSRIRLTGHGERTHAFLPPGDLYIVVRILAHERFERIAQNLLTSIEIDVFDALLGSETIVNGIDGSAIKVQIPAAIQHDQRLRIQGHGMPLANGEHLRGDLVLQVSVKIPHLTAEQRSTLESIRPPRKP
jgi:curved DNA-binding protein